MDCKWIIRIEQVFILFLKNSLLISFILNKGMLNHSMIPFSSQRLKIIYVIPLASILNLIQIQPKSIHRYVPALTKDS